MDTRSLDPPVVCFGGEDWWYHNRAHVDMQLMRRFAVHARVLYVNSIVMRKLNLGEGAMFLTRLRRKLRSVTRGIVEAAPGFSVYTPVTLPVHHVPLAAALNQYGLRFQLTWAMRTLGLRRPIVWVACPAACRTALSLPRSALVYQRTDRYEEYPGVDGKTIESMDRTLKRAADLTVFANHAMYEQEGPDCRRAYLLDHGVDYDLFARAHEDPHVPREMRDLARPVVGFFGGIDDHTSDIALAADVAARRPEMTFVFVGSVSADVSALRRLPNVHFVGQRPYDEIPHYGKCFDVAIMPWRRNRWIEHCNPIKLKEYLALGKPVVTTPFRGIEDYEGLVCVTRGAGQFADALERAVAQDNKDRRRARQERVRECTWEAKAHEVMDVLSTVL